VPEFGILGPVMAAVHGESQPLPGKQRVVLAALLLRAGRVVAFEELIDALWDAKPPPSARNTVQGHVKQLRGLLGPGIAERVVTRAPGYLIEVRPGELDLDNFTGLSDRGRAAAKAGDWEHAAELLAGALALWRGDPLSDVASATLQRSEVPRLAELRAQALDGRVEADLRSGRHQEVTAELRQLTAVHPYQEPAWAKLMLALYRSGRQGEALEAYRQARAALRDELGIEPGGELRRLHQRILAADPALIEGIPGIQNGRAAPAGGNGKRPAPAPAGQAPEPPPRQLPADVPDFTGRAREIRTLAGLLGTRDPGRPGAVVMGVLTGPAGIGKTALAVHVAHVVAERFPDGQLFVGLGGAMAALPPGEILARFLRDLGEPDAAIPVAEAERAARYRTVLASRKMLIVLDDARDAAQVRPLLPGAGGSAVIITSRGTLAGLVGATLVGLAPLDRDAARTLLTAIVGQPRATADPEGTDGVLTWCGGLPLALRIAGSRLAARPEWSITWLSNLLASEQRRLAELAVGDLAIRASIEVSYRALPAGGARLFRLFGLTQFKAVCPDALAALAGWPAAGATAAIEGLLEAHLLEPREAGRLCTHDLLRLYAAERAAAEETAQARCEALRRVLTWYLHAVHAAVEVLGKLRQPFPLVPLPEGVRPPVFGGLAESLAWLGTERANLIKTVGHAASAGLNDICHQLVRVLRGFYEWSGYWADLVTVSETGLAAAEAAGDAAAVATLLNILGSAHWKLGHLDAAIDHLSGSLGISRRLGDKHLQSMALSNLGHAESDAGLQASAIGRLTEALALSREIGNLTFEGYMLHNLGHVHLATGTPDAALDYFRRALEIRASLHALNDQAATLHSIGDTLLGLGRTEEAMQHLEQALAISRDNGMRYGEGLTLASLGDGWQALGQAGEARAAWRHAHEVLTEIGAAEAEGVLGRLTGGQSVPPAAAGAAGGTRSAIPG
jgi:DNA-binding SARP family transcriptional activator